MHACDAGGAAGRTRHFHGVLANGARCRRTSIRCKALIRLATVFVVAGVPLDALAGVVIEPSRTLTRETVQLEAKAQVYYAYWLAEGAELVFAARSSKWRRDPLRIWLVDEPNYHRMKAGEHFDYFAEGTGLTKRRARFVFTTPRTGMYYVLVDNSGAKRPAELSVYSYAKTPHPSAADVRTRDIYEGLYRELGTLLDFDNVEIHVRRCGRVTAFSTPNVVICTEFEELMSSGANPGVRLFVLMHEVAHSFLYSWGYRSTYRNQFMTDRLAATLIEMMDREELAAEAAEWFAENESFTAPSDVGAPFAISRQRAQRIANWLNDDEQLDLLWTKRIVFPRMHTAALEAIMERAELEPRTRSRIASELTKRREDASP